MSKEQIELLETKITESPHEMLLQPDDELIKIKWNLSEENPLLEGVVFGSTTILSDEYVHALTVSLLRSIQMSIPDCVLQFKLCTITSRGCIGEK